MLFAAHFPNATSPRFKSLFWDNKMTKKAIPSKQDNQTISIVDRKTLPDALAPIELAFRAQVIPENFEGFRADPNSPAIDILMEALKVLIPDQPGFSPEDYRIYIASPLIDEQGSSSILPKRTKGNINTPLGNLLNNGDYVFFVKPESKTSKLEIWIRDQKILVFDKTQVLIGRRDEKKGIVPEIDLTPHLGDNALRISRKQAWLMENNGRWTVCLDENARSPVYLNGKEQLEPGVNYDVLNETRLGFGGLPNQSYLYMTLRITR